MTSHAKNVTAYRDLLIGNAVKARKIAPDRAEDYRRLFDADPNGITHLLTAPVREGGLMAGNAAAVAPYAPGEQPDEYPREWIEQRRPSGAVAFEDHGTAADAMSGAMPAPRATPGVPAAPSSHITIGND